MYGILTGLLSLIAIIFFIVILLTGGGGDSPLIAWSLFLIACFGAWYCYKKQKETDDNEQWKKQRQTEERLSRISGYRSTQKFTSSSGDVTFSIDESSKQFTVVSLNSFKDKVYKYKDILKSEILTDGVSVTSTNRGSQVGGALLGGLLAGGVGALIGGLSGSQTSQEKIMKIELIVIVTDTTNPVHKISFLDSFPHAKDSQAYKDAYAKAHHCHQLIAVLIRQADDEDGQSELINTNRSISMSTQQGASVADELKKLKQLKDEGILTDEEFDAQKQKLIGG